MEQKLKEKVSESIILLHKAEQVAYGLNPRDGFYLGFSGGKDSVALLQIAKLAGIHFKAVHNLTGIDSPVTIHFIQDYFPEVVIHHPKENYLQLVEKYGLPQMNKRYCCRLLKERLGAGNVVLTGVRRDESLKRSFYSQVVIWSNRKEHEGKDKSRSLETIIQNEHQCIKGKDRLMIYPLLGWSEKDVWDFIKEFNLPINPCYRMFNRVGCMYCPFASRKQIEAYEQAYPLYHKRLMLSLSRWWCKTDNHLLSSVDEYYDWWKSRKSLKYYKEILNQKVLF